MVKMVSNTKQDNTKILSGAMSTPCIQIKALKLCEEC